MANTEPKIVKFPSKEERDKIAEQKKLDVVLKRLLGEAAKIKW